MKHITTPSRLRAAVASFGLLAIPSLHAADLYWDGSGTNWFTASAWSTDSSATTPDPAATPTIADNLFFNITGVTTAQTISLNGAGNPVPTANSFTFNSGGSVLFGGGGNRDVAFGAGGITVNSGAGAVTFGTTSSGSNVYARITANQTWTNNSASQLRMVNAASATATGTTPVTLTVQNTSTGATTFSNNLNNGAGGAALSLVVNSSGSGITNLAGGNFSGGLTIQRGLVQTGSASTGTGAITLSASAATTATLRINTTNAVVNNFVASAGGGTNTLEFISTSGTVSGNILLNGALNIGVRNSGATGVTINGVISGTGDLIKGQYQSGNSQVLILAGANTYTGDTFVNNGAFTLADTGSLTFAIGANGDNNQVTGTSTGAVTFAGSFNFDLTGAELVDGNTWTIVNRSALTGTSFAATFQVTGFTELDNVWTNGSGFSFDEASGVLSYTAIPEPSSYALLAGAGMIALSAGRRRR